MTTTPIDLEDRLWRAAEHLEEAKLLLMPACMPPQLAPAAHDLLAGYLHQLEHMATVLGRISRSLAQ